MSNSDCVRLQHRMAVAREAVADQMSKLYQMIPAPERKPMQNYRHATFQSEQALVGASYANDQDTTVRDVRSKLRIKL